MKNKRFLIIITGVVVIVAVIVAVIVKCSTKKEERKTDEQAVVQKRLSTADAISVVRQDTKLYSAEQTAHKDIVISTKEVSSILGYEFTRPWSKSTYKIPIDVTYKASIDLSKITDRNISINDKDSSITIVLPDPTIEMTSCEVRHEDEEIHQQIFANTQSQEFFNDAIRGAEQGIWAEVSMQRKDELLTSAKRSAEGVMADALLRMGFKKVNITYSSSMNVNGLPIDLGNTIENLNAGK